MKNDIISAFRQMRSSPWFCLSIIVTIALGIGINTSVFTFTNAVLFKPVPVTNGERLVAILGQDFSGESPRRTRLSYPDYEDMKAEATQFEAFELLNHWSTVLSEEGNPPEQYSVKKVSPGLFDMIEERPIRGSGFSVKDGEFEDRSEVLISYRLWQTRYGGEDDVVGKSVQIGGVPSVIIGVMREGFRFPNNADIWIPFVADEGFFNRENRWIDGYGILEKGVSSEDAAGELAIVASQNAKAYPDSNENLGVIVMTFHELFNGGEIRIIFLVMMGAVGFVLLIACANVANLMLSRGLTRTGEMSIRASLGASRWQLVRQLLIESVTLSVVGGVLGLGLTALVVGIFDDWTSDVRPYWIEFTMDYRVVFYFSLMTIGSGVCFGLVPALRPSKANVGEGMKEGARSSGTKGKGKLTGALVVLQFSMTMALLAGAGMMVKGFFYQSSQNEFLPIDSLFTGRFELPAGSGERYESWEDRLMFYDKAMESMESLDGVTHASFVSHLPGRGANRRSIEVEGRPVLNTVEADQASTIVETVGYLETIGLSLQEGRQFAVTDNEDSEPVAIASRSFAARYWSDESAVGKRFRILREDKEPGDWITIVGVAEEMNQEIGRDDAQPVVHLPLLQNERTRMFVVLRTLGDPLLLSRPAKSVIERMDPMLPLYEVNSMRQVIDRQLWMFTVFGSLFMCFAAIGLFMASMGVYAVVAQSMSLRTREIGIRIALGATRASVQGLVLGRGMIQMGIGLAIGLALSIGVCVVMSRGFLERASPFDPVVLGGVSLVLTTIGVVACWIPARRGARMDPIEALRAE